MSSDEILDLTADVFLKIIYRAQKSVPQFCFCPFEHTTNGECKMFSTAHVLKVDFPLALWTSSRDVSRPFREVAGWLYYDGLWAKVHCGLSTTDRLLHAAFCSVSFFYRRGIITKKLFIPGRIRGWWQFSHIYCQTLPSILYKVWLLINRSICLSTTITEVQLNHAILHRFQLRHVFDLQWWSRYIRRPTTVVPTIGFESPCSRTRVVAESTILLSFVVCRGSHTRSSLQCSPWSIYYNEATPRERSDRLLFFTLGRSVSAWIDCTTVKHDNIRERDRHDGRYMYIPSFALPMYKTTCHAKPYLYRSVQYRYLSTLCV